MSPERTAPGVRDLGDVFSAEEPGRRGEILAAALEVFGESGYDCGSMRAIAERVGVTEPALYRHFPGKDAILTHLLTVVAMRLRTEVLGIVAGLHAEGLRRQMLEALRRRRDIADVYGPLMRIVLPVAARDPKLRAAYRELVVVPVFAALTAKAAEIDATLGVPLADETRESRVRSVAALVVGYIASAFVLGDQPDEAIVDAALRIMGWDASL